MVFVARVPKSEKACGIDEHVSCGHKECGRSRRVVLPFGLALACRATVRNGSMRGSPAIGASTGSRRAAGLPRCDRTKRSPFAIRRSTRAAFWRSSTIVIVFMNINFKLKLNRNTRLRLIEDRGHNAADQGRMISSGRRWETRKAGADHRSCSVRSVSALIGSPLAHGSAHRAAETVLSFGR